METIERHTESVMDESVLAVNDVVAKGKKKMKSLLPKAGLIIAIFLMFLMVVVMTTDVQLASITDWAGIGLSFFILFFAQYATYIASSDSGIRAGIESDVYKEAIKKHNEYKKKANEEGYTARLNDFCNHYCDTELKNMRRAVMIEVGITYEKYAEDFLGKDDKQIKKLPYPNTVKKAAIAANEIRRIKLTPDMILRRERLAIQRNPLGIDPQSKLKKAYGMKFFSSAAIALLMSSIVFDMLVDFTWASIAGIALKIMLTIASIWSGYSMGYNNKATDAAGYLNDQCDLFLQLFDFVDKEKKHDITGSDSTGGCAGTERGGAETQSAVVEQLQ